MTIKVLITKPNGGVKILTPAPEALAKGMTLKEIVEVTLQPGETWKQIDSKDVPTERYFRDAWVESGGSIQVSKDQAEVLKMTSIRRTRKKEFEVLDTEFARSMETMQLAQFQLDELDKVDPTTSRTPSEQKQTEQQQQELGLIIQTSKGEMRAIGLKKQALRDIPQTVNLVEYDLERMQYYVPKELVHRTDNE